MNTRQVIYSRPATAPMDLDVGKPTPKAALLTSGLTLVFMLFAAIGAWVAYAFQPQYNEWNFARFTGASLGTMIALFGLVQSYLYTRITWSSWSSYNSRLDDWHETMLNAYAAVDGQETTVETNQFFLSCDMPHHVLITALVIHRKVMTTATTRQLPYSRRGLEETLYLGANDNHNLLKVGELTGTMPERMSAKLASLGLITGRANNTAGYWIPQSTDEVIELVTRNWSKSNDAN